MASTTLTNTAWGELRVTWGEEALQLRSACKVCGTVTEQEIGVEENPFVAVRPTHAKGCRFYQVDRSIRTVLQAAEVVTLPRPRAAAAAAAMAAEPAAALPSRGVVLTSISLLVLLVLIAFLLGAAL